MAPMAPFQPSELYPMMVAALITNKPEFVKLFLENGVQLKEFVSQATLFYLYQNLEPTCLGEGSQLSTGPQARMPSGARQSSRQGGSLAWGCRQ